MEYLRKHLRASFSVSFTFSFVHICSEIHHLIHESCIALRFAEWRTVDYRVHNNQFYRLFRHHNLAGLSKISVFCSEFQHFCVTRQMLACSVPSQRCTSLPVVWDKK